MLLASPLDSSVDLTLTVSGESGGVTGLTATVRIRDGATTNSYLDFADNTFKTSGWTNRDGAMTDIGDGDYTFDLDVDVLNLDVGDMLVAEYHTEGALVTDASDTIAIGERTRVALTLTVADMNGGVTGLTAVVEVRRGGTADSYLDWNDLTFKTAGWGTRQAAMTDIGRGHYHRALDLSAVIPAVGPDDEVVAEFETTGTCTVSANDTLEIESDVADAVPPSIEDFDPPLGTEVEPFDTVAFSVIDANLAVVAVLAKFEGLGRYDVVHDGSEFGPDYRFSSRVAIAQGWRYTLRRQGGWPHEPLRVRVLARDTSGNAEVIG